ncbi:hypothetical protein F4801DRAFT_512710 [Xylaria longipes]|nr:hypothetical protein F4801DRAFT_512710 [Xylaria longipes]
MFCLCGTLHIDVPQDQSLMCLKCINYFQRTDLGYPLVDASLAMSHVKRPIFSCALKFTFTYLTRTYASEYRKTVWEYLEECMGTPQFCSLVECGLLIFQHESTISSEQHGEIMEFISWVLIKYSVDQLPITPSFLRAKFKEELARREKIFGLDDDRSRTWKSIGDILDVPSEDSQITVSGLHNAEDNHLVKDIEMVSGIHVDGPRQTMNVKARRVAEHTAMLKVGDMLAAKAPVLQALIRVVPRFTSIVPELLPIPFLILLALKDINQTRKKQYWSSALKRLAGANNFFEAYCAFELGMCRYWEDQDQCDETVEGLLNRCRRITLNLPSSLHVDVLLCSTLRWLAQLLVKRDQFLEAQEIVSELQQRLSKGPTKGYVSTPLERKLYYPLFWDDWKAELLAGIAEDYAFQWANVYNAKALSILDSNIQLYKNPGHGRINASIIAHRAKAKGLCKQWHSDGSKIPSELAHKSEAACQVTLQLAKFPNSVKYTNEQWSVIETLCRLLHRQRRYREARELISRIPADFPPTTCMYTAIGVAATAACLGDIETGVALLERASLEIKDQQVSLRRSESKHIANLIAALNTVRPIVRLYLLVSLCYRKFVSEDFSKALLERDFWYKHARTVPGVYNHCFGELWDIFYIRYLALADYDDDHTRNMASYVRVYRYEPQGDYRHTEFVPGCEELAFKYAKKQKYEAAAVVSRYLISYALQRNPVDSFQWSLYYLALYLHFKFRGEEALALCRFMLLRTEKCVSCEYKWWSYLNIGIACFKIGVDHKRNGNALSVEFFKLALVSFGRARDNGALSTVTNEILRWFRASRFAIERLGVVGPSLQPAALPEVIHNVRYWDGIPKHQSCPDLRASYVKEAQSHRTAYNLWRKQGIRPTLAEQCVYYGGTKKYNGC